MSSRLDNLSPVPGSRHRRKRRGIGEASGLGKTSGRGGKGQTARTGGTIHRHFEGGQMPLYRRIPKVGFRSRKDIIGDNRYSLVSLSWLSTLEDGTEVTPEFLVAQGFKIKQKQSAGFKVLGSGAFSKKLTLKVHAISEAARAAIESAGGSVEII